jgi:tRNA pseudouridine38-40 synthase
MNIYKLIVAYNGSFFKGWQTQGKNPNTAQEFLTENLKAILRVNDLHLYGASRTDALVHASYQVVKLEIDKEIDPIKVIRGFNQAWGEKLKIMSLEKAHSSFNPLKEIDYKEYHYSFSLHEPHPLISNHIFFQREKIDLKQIRKACELIVGTHDFSFLSVKGSGSENRIREVLSCELNTFQDSFGEEIYIIKIQAAGFLKYMVRMIVDALFRVGIGELSLTQLKTQLSGVKTFEPKKAKPYGLNLFLIRYKEL